MNKIMENLITNKYYSTKEEVEQKLSVFFAFNIIQENDYTQLMQLTDEKYKDESDVKNEESGSDTSEGALN
ncbi:hypothetical protein HMPREF1084_01923 [Clostridium butyricum 60E.3]|jgi:hypothetical protein|uniref:hypothetical protein n=1 Tax=Clostridium butyricum TaxID=1492 RepID=UPI0002D16FF5|nr:hypothetical protein [Clostridium butyricum]ALP91166.1 hypothetical protein ATN24_13800 [Clostridium butyricum]ANF14789.1 hypothetical protein AZ909_12255 [Clostridium butyricum]ENZ33454.1 hypothetical protein HMPREF1084_01923 [Clostridium butyricum 60E.3]MCI3009015.1 hypothetical protein [Clostridium butyricum]MDP0841079.1 hypothetical protein [Clostridium butyricum]